MGSRAVVALAVVFLIGAASGLTVCDLLFGCGCRPLWASAAAHCDITVPGSPDCPICASSPVRLAAFGGTIGLTLIGAVVGVARHTKAGVLSLVAVGTLVYLGATTLGGAALAAIDGNDRFGAVFRSLPPPQHPLAR